ncbi:NAD(P)-binding protein [Lojkania enalia]|uniref:NAD(P)-binding protein n=1 Tax=Lojkania enalia TaxID=147567 RepID=A0A9P4NCS8_9PLEO|nr:NAD(P)-binding protein [Didymosphaeria enalia]
MSTPEFLKVHSTAYPAIDPTQPSLSAAGKTVLITGGATGIGIEIARSFAAAGASTVILVARRANTLQSASEELSKKYPSTQILAYPTNITDTESVEKLFKSAVEASTSQAVDILITSAAYFHEQKFSIDIPLRASFETNVLGNLNLVRSFLAAPSATQKIILDVSTEAAFGNFPTTAAYGATKYAFTHMMKHLQEEHPELRVHSFHPGGIWTPAMENSGIQKEQIEHLLDEVELPGQFAVWLASEQAAFLKGRMVMAKWDVEDMVKNQKAFVIDPLLATITLKV